MADLAIGISKAAVEALVTKVQSAIKEEAEKWRTVQRDLVFIMDEFEMMQSFLDSGDWDRVKNNVVRTWVRQVRTLSNDVEDCIDFVLHLDTKKRTWWLQMLPLPLPSCGKAEAASGLDQAVADIAQLKARVVDVSQRNMRYNLISDSDSRPQETAIAAASKRDILINSSKKKGGLSDLEGLITREDKDLQVISVCGTEGDVGKIAMARKVYSDSTIYEKFECRAWLKLTHPFNPHEFIRSFMTQFYMDSCKEQEDVIVGLHAMNRVQATQQDDLLKEFAQKVGTHRYLIVVEDLNTTVEWDAIRSYLPDRKKGSRIVLLTHQPMIASLCTGEPCQISELMQFSTENPVHVYFKEGFIIEYQTSIIMAERFNPLCNHGLIGRDTEVDELLEHTQEHRLISMWGMPGVGKSALVGAIWHQLLFSNSHNFKRHAWVSVCHPLDPRQFSLSLLVDLDSIAAAQLARDPIKECQHLLESKCLVVIDGLQSKEDWDWIKSNFIQYGHSESRIIVITSDECVAKHCVVSSNGIVCYINGLQADAARELFKKVIAAETGSRLESEMQKPADHFILSKCGGLPKLIVTLARYLATKPRDVLRQEMRRLSDNLMQEIETNPEFDSLRVLPAWMHCYFNNSCRRALKKHMLYLSIFPQGQIIRRRRLIRRWIAEGYSMGTDGKTMEEYAEKLFSDLAALRSIMQPVLMPKTSRKVIGYRVNGFFREYILSKPVEDRSFFPVEVSALAKGHGHLTTTQGIGRHLAVEGTWGEDPVVFKSLDLTRLRSFTLFARGSMLLFLRDGDVRDWMRVLRVLDLEGTVLNDHRLQGIGKLPARLKFLFLRGCRLISCLPDYLALGDLMQLQTLDIRDTSIVRLPPCITRLRSLQYLRAGTTTTWTDDDNDDDDHTDRLMAEDEEQQRRTTTSSCWAKIRRRGLVVGSPPRSGGGVDLPRGSWKLEAMQTLGVVHAFTADTMHEIRYLSFAVAGRLKKLQVSGINPKSRGYVLRNILAMNYQLESLSLQFEKNSHFTGRDTFFVPEDYLRSLTLYGNVLQLPRNTSDLGHLMKLALEKATLLTPEETQVLGNLPRLRTLRLRVNEGQDGDLRFPAGLFSELQDLEIMCESRLHVVFGLGAMEKLQVLKVQCSNDGSSMQFSGIESLKSLELVWVHGSFGDALKDALEWQLHLNLKNPALKLQQQERRRSPRASSTS